MNSWDIGNHAEVYTSGGMGASNQFVPFSDLRLNVYDELMKNMALYLNILSQVQQNPHKTVFC
jgi:hypothetical protein